MNKRERHDHVVAQTIARLEQSGNYKTLDSFIEYEDGCGNIFN